MTALFTLATENGTNGNDATEALTSYTSITQTPPKYANDWAIAGSLSLKSTLTGTSCLCRTDFTAAARRFARKYMKVWGLPSANTAFWGVYDSAHVHLGDVRMLTDGTVQLRNAGSVGLQTSSHAFAAGDVFRVEYDANVGGTSTVRLFWGANIHGTTADESLSGTNGTAGTGLIAQLNDGAAAGVTWTHAWDETVVDDTTWVGPIGGGSSSPYPVSGTIAAVSDMYGNPTTAGDLVSSRVRIFVGDAIPAPPADSITNALRWAWGGFGYAYPGSTFTAESGGMRLYWGTPAFNAGGTEFGCVFMDPAVLIAGHEIKVKAVVNVPVGSPDVRLTNGYTLSGPYVSVKGKDVALTLRFDWDPGRSTTIGIESAAGAVTGSVLVKSLKVMDLTEGSGKWAPQLTAPAADTTAPSTPGQPSATVTNNSVALTWTASTDNVAVTGYEVHRSATTGFTPGPSTLLTTVPTNAYTDVPVANGTYYYKVIASDAAGNKSAASTQRSVTVSYTPPANAIMMGISTQNSLGGRTDWDGYRTYTNSRLLQAANRTGWAAGIDVPKYHCYSKQGSPFTGTAASITAAVKADLDAFYYTGGSTSQTHSARWGQKLYWMNGNENYASGEPGTVAAYTESMRGLWEAITFIDPTTGQRRYPDAYCGSNPTHDQENNGLVEAYLHPTARYHHFVCWSMYPPGRNTTPTDPTYNWPSTNPADLTGSPPETLVFMLRCFYRTYEAQQYERARSGNSNFKLTISCGEIANGSDPNDETARPYYVVRGLMRPVRLLAATYGLTVDFMTWWDNEVGDGHSKILDEGAASDHATGQTNPNPSTAAAWRNYPLYDPDLGGSYPGSWAGNPKAGWKHTGTQV